MRTVAAAVLLSCLGATAHAQQEELQTLVDRLGSDDARTRSSAYSELQRRRDPAMVPLIARRVGDYPIAAQQFAVYLLQGQPIDTTRAVYVKWLGAEQPFLRVAGAALLVRSGDRSRLTVLAAAVKATPANARSQAVGAVWGITDEALFAALRSYLTTDAPSALAMQVLSLLQQQERNHRSATMAVVETLAAATDRDLRCVALAYLVASGSTQHVAPLADLLGDAPQLFWNASSLLDDAVNLPKEITEAAAAALSKPRSRFDVTRIATLLRKHAPQTAAAALRQLLTDQRQDVAAAALEALASMPDGLLDKDLTAMLHGADVDARIVAATTLRRRDDLSGLPVLLELVKAEGPTRLTATRALAGFRSRTTVPALLDLLDDANEAVRAAAWQGLQGNLRDLFPQRRFDFDTCGYSPNQTDRSGAIATLRAWWRGVS